MARIGGSARRLLITPTTGQVTTSVRPARIFYENGTEVQLVPLQSGLTVRAHYHVHPWVQVEGKRKNIVIFDHQVGWDDLCHPLMPAHQRIAFIGSLPRQENPGALATHLNAAEQDRLAVTMADFRVLLGRQNMQGLEVSFERDTQAPIGILKSTQVERSGKRIRDIAAQWNASFDTLPTWKRVTLHQATDIAPMFHFITDSIVQSAMLLRTFIIRKIKV